jgi:hypothetical protein
LAALNDAAIASGKEKNQTTIGKQHGTRGVGTRDQEPQEIGEAPVMTRACKFLLIPARECRAFGPTGRRDKLLLFADHC